SRPHPPPPRTGSGRRPPANAAHRPPRPSPAPARARHAAPDGQAHPQPTDQPPSPPTRAGVASKPQSRPGTISGHIAAPPLRFLARRLIAATSAQSPPTAPPRITHAPSSPPGAPRTAAGPTLPTSTTLPQTHRYNARGKTMPPPPPAPKNRRCNTAAPPHTPPAVSATRITPPTPGPRRNPSRPPRNNSS